MMNVFLSSYLHQRVLLFELPSVTIDECCNARDQLIDWTALHTCFEKIVDIVHLVLDRLYVKKVMINIENYIIKNLKNLVLPQNTPVHGFMVWVQILLKI